MSMALRYLLETGLCLALFYAGFWLFLRRETYFLLNRIYLVASLVLSFLIPAFKVASPFATYVVPSASTVEMASLPSLPEKAIGLGLTDILFWAYLAGAAFFLIRFGAHLLKLYLVIRRNGYRSLGGLKVVSIDKEFAPFSFLGYVFLNRPGSEPLNLKPVLAHERAHVRQRHSLDILLVEGATVLQWFNPIVRPYKRSIQETHEFLADGEVIAQGFDAARYRLTLLEQQVGARLLEFSHEFRQSQIKRRITMMSHARSKGAARLKVLVLLPLAMLLVLALAQPRPIGAANRTPVSIGQEKSATTEPTLSREELIARAKMNLEILAKKQAELKQALESATDPAQREDIQKSLQKLAEFQKINEAFLKDPDHAPAPKLLPPPALKGKADLKMLMEKQAEIEAQLAKETDPAKVADLKAMLEKVHAKRKDLEAKLKQMQSQPHQGMESKAEIEKLMDERMKYQQIMADKEQWNKLSPDKKADIERFMEKTERLKDLNISVSAHSKDMLAKIEVMEAAARKELAETQDPEKKAKLEKSLKELQLKRQELKAVSMTHQSEVGKEFTLDELEKMSKELKVKEAEIQAELAKTQDAEQTAKLKDMLDKVRAKQETCKAMIEKAHKGEQK